MERGIIRERVQAEVRAAKAKGTRLGRPQRVFRRDEALRTAGRGEELEKCRAKDQSAYVHRD
jgi:DNA invertase Pin-like site-specific DNA recombinase